MSKIKKFYRPENLDTALELLSDEKNMVIGGGTTVAMNVPGSISGLVSLKKLQLSEMKVTGSKVEIGGGTTAQELYKWEGINNVWGGILTSACRNIGSTLTRNLVTVGGNIVSVFPWSDIPVVLMLLDGNVVSTGNNKVPFQKYFEKSPVSQGYGKDKIITGIEIEKNTGNEGYFWETFQKTKVDFAMTTICGLIKTENKIVKELRLAIGAVSVLPVRLTGVENALIGKELTESALREALKKEFENVKIRDDFRVSKGYICEVTENLIVKNLMKGL
ncbi:FAD binding domain-containing protein [bacterium]|nr:FAD binding domain-containing protein [bacterium]